MLITTTTTYRASSATPESICHGTHCSRILTAVAYDQGFQVLARGSDNAIKANQYYGTGVSSFHMIFYICPISLLFN